MKTAIGLRDAISLLTLLGKAKTGDKIFLIVILLVYVSPIVLAYLFGLEVLATGKQFFQAFFNK